MKKPAIIALVIGLIAAIAATTLFFVNRSNPVDEIAAEIQKHEGESPAISNTLATKVPEESIFVVSTTDKENMNEWWQFFSRLDYYDPALPPALDEKILPDELLFAAFPVETEEGTEEIVTAFYIRADGKALDFHEWIVTERNKSIEGIEEDPELAQTYSLPVVAHEDFIVIPSRAEGYNKSVDYIYDENSEEVEVDGITALEEWEKIGQINDSILWADFDAYLNFYTDKAEDEIKDSTWEILNNAAGYESATTFMATSKDFGETWSGIFPTGGLNPDKVDLFAVEKMISDSIVILDETQVASPVVEGLMPIASTLSASHKDEEGNIQTFGAVRPTQTDTEVTALVSSEDEFKSSVTLSPQVWASLFEGSTDYENISHVSLDVTENNSGRLSFFFYEQPTDEDVS